jgi:prolyl oligopeptidase
MKLLISTLAACLLMNACTNTPTPPPPAAQDPHLWLEEVQGDKALAWVRERNQESRAVLEKHPRFESTRSSLLAILDSKDKIPAVKRRGEHLYNLWQDAQNPRGLWRRTSLAEYRKPQPAWETVLDLDALGAAEKENWVWKDAVCFGGASGRCLLNLSRGGADAVVVREFDTQSKRFIDAKDGGFVLPEAKTSIEWLDANTLLVGSDFGPGSLTESGYPRVIKRWQRGTPLSEAKTVFEGEAKDVFVYANVDRTPGFERTLFGRATDFYNTGQWLQQGDQQLRLDYPSDALLSFWREHVLIQLRSDWTVGGATWPRGALLVAPAKDYLAGQREFTALFRPTATRSLDGYTTTRSHVMLSILDNVAGRVQEWRLQGKTWTSRDVATPFPGNLGVQALHDPLAGPNDTLAENYLLTYADFTTPDSLMLGATGGDTRELLKSRPRQFNGDGVRVEQRFATSKDSTRVPYFVVWPQNAKADGRNPTLLYGYGGFEVPLQPWYSAGYGSAWYSQGGVLVVANIRGGGEFGPAWHQAALRENRQKSFDDFIAVAEDLIAAKITSPRHLGIEGGSNGGLLVGAVMLQRPELFNAVVCQVPLLDMQRFHKLLAGASWVAEYGDPDKAQDWAFISRYSPYQRVQRGMKLPKTLLTTSTRDDRVHPGHARKMAARLQEQGHAVLYYENTEGGHAGAANNAQRADVMALEFSFLWQQLGR